MMINNKIIQLFRCYLNRRTEKKQIWLDDKKLAWKEAWHQVWHTEKKLIWVPSKVSVTEENTFIRWWHSIVCVFS